MNLVEGVRESLNLILNRDWDKQNIGTRANQQCRVLIIFDGMEPLQRRASNVVPIKRDQTDDEIKLLDKRT